MSKSAIRCLSVAIIAILVGIPGAAQDTRKFLPKMGRAAVQGEYLVTFAPGASVADLGQSLASAHGGRVGRSFGVINGVLMQGLNRQAAEALSRNPNVELVEANTLFSPTQLEPASTGTSSANQSNPPNWGLDRVDQRNLPLDGAFVTENDGAGVNIYILDTGINPNHAEFQNSNGTSRVVLSAVTTADGGTADDCIGHGSHVAAVIGGNTFGVARAATLKSVRVINCETFDGSADEIIAGLDFAVADATGTSVINMSLSGDLSATVNSAVNNAVSAGHLVVVSASNEAEDACNFSPAAASSALTVAASTITDDEASFSNFGTCVDLHAPGEGITSAWLGSDTATEILDGTSQSAAHTAGAAALFLADRPRSASTLRNLLIAGATAGAVNNPGVGSPNRLLFARHCRKDLSRLVGTATANGQNLISAEFNGGGFFEAGLTCDAGVNAADLDLFLDSLFCNFFNCFFDDVARGTSPDCTEEINFQDGSGPFTYRWRVNVFSGISSGETVPLTICVNQGP